MRRCPSCGNEILIYRSKKGYSLVCLRCRTGGDVEAENEEDAYKKFIQKFEAEYGSLPPELKRIFAISGIEVVNHRTFEEEDPPEGRKTEELDIHPKLRKYLEKRNIKRLYAFQEKALDLILNGKNVVIEAPTGTGKTEAFTLPVVEAILRGKKKRALFLYPTKALARDQLQKLLLIEELTGVRFRVFDGDTPKEERERIYREKPEILISNPDTVHLHLTMPWSEFGELIKSIDFLVIDEVHTYTGVLGSHLHYIIARLKRFTEFQIIGSSATLPNAREFGEMLFGERVEVVRGKGRKSRVHFAMLYPLARSEISLILEILKILKGKSTIVFANTHRMAELITRAAKKSGLKVEIHRAGLPMSKRRDVEERFRRGEIKAVVATPTLELGIDIGRVGAVVSNLVDFSRLVQRLGRAGRRGEESIALLILRANEPISEYFRRHPKEYFSELQPCYIEPKNEIVAKIQLLASALDKPLAEEEFSELEDLKAEVIEERLAVKSGRFLFALPQARKIVHRGIRGIGEAVRIKLKGRVIGERSLPIALRELFPGAVYLHGGESYRSLSLDLAGKVAEVEPFDEDIKTEALRYTMPEIVEVVEKRLAFSSEIMYCRLRITEVVHGYVEKDLFSSRKIREVELDNPLEYSYPTYGFVFRAPQPETGDTAGSFHALEHVLIEGSNLLLGGGSAEIGGVSLGESGMVFIYDGSPGGNGLAKLLYSRFESACRRAVKILEECPCKREDGCPKCTYSYRCGNNNKPLHKRGALSSLQKIVKGVATQVGEFIPEMGYI